VAPALSTQYLFPKVSLAKICPDVAGTPAFGSETCVDVHWYLSAATLATLAGVVVETRPESNLAIMV
jgi:hypothetical protein